MTEPSEPARRRRRRRASAPQGPARPRAAMPENPPATPAPPTDKRGDRRTGGKRRRPARETNDRTGDRGMRDLVGSGRSAVGVDGALRARDVNRPSAEDLAEAERDIVIVRRHWRPPPGDGR